MRLRSQVALVTGASRGLGKAISLRLCEEGADLVLVAREQAPLIEVAGVLARLAQRDQRVIYECGDISQPRDVQRVFESTLRAFDRLDVLVCNAGVYGPFGPIETVDWNAWMDAVHVNLLGTVLCCRNAVPIMSRQGRGKIITLSGGGATQPLPRISAYAASKAGVVRFTETLAEELRGTGIDVNSIAPGPLNTRLLDEVLEAGPERVGEAFYVRSLEQKERGGVSLELGADLVAFLASADSDGITGRLLSAVWDDWHKLPSQMDRLMSSDVYTLRRIVPADRGWGGE